MNVSFPRFTNLVLRKSRDKTIASTVKVSNSSWRVAWGKINTPLAHVVWQDGEFAVICEEPGDIFAVSPTGEFVVVGDIWLSNRQELWQKLGLEPQLESGSDRDLVARLWEKGGQECLQWLVGMFALVVWDRNHKVLWLGRDRVGCRTLYYTNTGAVRWIAPKLRSLGDYRSANLDLVALRDYLCCGFVLGERTLWEDIREVRPGTAVRFPHQEVHIYWQVQEKISPVHQSLEYYAGQLRCLLEQVVREYLPENQPVGVFLSGGLDSSCIAALAAKFHHQPVHTYSIHFGSECANELEFSSLVAQSCQTEHHILEITFRDMWEYLPEAMLHLDDPIGDPLTVPNLLLGKLAQQQVGIILNGEGGDPCFGGPKNQAMLINSLYGGVSQRDGLTAYLSSFKKCADDLETLLQPQVYAEVMAAESVFTADLNSDANYLNRLMTINIKYKGADQILTKVNNLTSAVQLQGRSPLFDQRIVELSMGIPPEYKLSGVEEKAVLKQAVADILPATIIQRPKSGMMVPVQLGFRKYWHQNAKKLLLNKNSAIAPYLNRTVIRDWLNYRGDIWGRYGVKLWLLASLEIWLQTHRK